jgi:hypothetical protein
MVATYPYTKSSPIADIHGVRSYDVIIRELAFHLMIKRGLKDSDENRTILNEEMQARINTWLK